MKKREDEAFKIKNANLGLFVMHLQTTDLGQIEVLLAKRVAQSPAFFAGVAMAVALGNVTETDKELDFPGLIALMLKQGIGAAGVIGGSEAQRKAALAAGLGSFLEAPPKTAGREPKVDAAEFAESSDSSKIATTNASTGAETASENVQAELPGLEALAAPKAEITQTESVQSAQSDSPTAVDAPAKTEAAPLRKTLIIEKPVRTGQRIYAEGADLVVLATVNAGAELIADGDIHVYAPLRGRALAGARGNTAARIFVMAMEAELVAIAGIFQVFEDGIPVALRGKPTQVTLEGERVTLLPLSSPGR